MSAITSIAQNAYLNTLKDAIPSEKMGPESKVASFESTIEKSLEKVNQLQEEKDRLIEEFAVGKNENVHEVMIALQKADIAIKLTSAVRNKMLDAYKQLLNMPI